MSSLHEVVRAGAPVTEALKTAQRWELREALEIAVERDDAMIEVLLDGGASLAARDMEGHTPLALAVRVARDDAAALFRSRGACDDEASDADRLLGACIRGGRPAGTAVWRHGDHQHLCWAVRSRHVAAI